MEAKLKKKLLTLRLTMCIMAVAFLIVGVVFTFLFIEAKKELELSDPYEMNSALFFRTYSYRCVFIFFYCFAFFSLSVFLISVFVCHYVKIPVEFNEVYLYVGVGTMSLFINGERAAIVSTKHLLSIEGRLRDNVLIEVSRTGQKQYRVKFSDNRPYMEIDAKSGNTKYFG